MTDVAAGGKPSKGTPKDKRLKENKDRGQVKVTRAGNVETPHDVRITHG